MTNREGVLPWIILILLALIWGSSFILIKKGLVIFAPAEVAAIRVLSASLFLLPISIRPLRALSRKNIVLLFVAGLVGSLVPAFLFALAQTKLDSAVTGVMNALTPLSVVIIGALFFSQRFQTKNYIGLGLGFAGTAALIVAGSDIAALNVNYYAFFVILATVCYGLNLNLIKFRLAEISPQVISGVSLMLVSIIPVIYLFGISDFSNKIVNEDGAWLALFYLILLGIAGTAIALVIFNRLVQISTPIFASFVTYLIPIVAIFWGVLDGESLYLTHYIGMALIIAGVYISNRKK